MSARQCFALCIDCWEMHYGIADSNGVYTRDSASSNHADHAVHVFGDPNSYPKPIGFILAALHVGMPISNGQMEMFSLACAIHSLQPTNGIAPTFDRAPFDGPEPEEEQADSFEVGREQVSGIMTLFDSDEVDR